ncbi:PIN domain-containing protein [Paraglaciecola sp. MB-3u-78]|uniref:PIN domain-containing protein n=1 Tax=Paraglaciecola sp. MB-3u-78 TaxID=2058332 RepID=UPI001E531C7D|nr:PIN domain-containing protein [Paraglaciecola sp. MB-3u-78]
MKNTYMLDTNTCSFIMRERPLYLLKVLQAHVENKDRIVISAITYAEMRFGAIGKKASPKHNIIVDEFMSRIDSVFAWDKYAVEASTVIKKDLSDKGTPIGANDTAIAGHAMASDCILVTNNTREFKRVIGLQLEDWTQN